MTHTVVGVFDTREEAERVRNQLVNLGVSSADLRVRGRDAAESAEAGRDGGLLQFFRAIFGIEHDDHSSRYSEAVRRGGYVVCANAPDDDYADRIATVMNQAGAVDPDACGSLREGDRVTASDDAREGGVVRVFARLSPPEPDQAWPPGSESRGGERERPPPPG